MANNRLFIMDTETGDIIMLAKSMGVGWYTRGGIEQRLDDFFDEDGDRDQGASYGAGGISRLVIRTEGEIPKELWDKHMERTQQPVGVNNG